MTGGHANRGGDRQSEKLLVGQAQSWPTVADHGEARATYARGNPTLTGATRDWATPTAHDGRRPGQDHASTQGANLSRDAAKWPTPKARDWKGGGGMKERHSPDLDKIAEASALSPQATPTTTTEPSSTGAPSTSGEASSIGVPTSRQRLNPLFVEWLMGWPEGWTSLAPTGCASSETASSHSRPPSPFGYSPRNSE